MSSVTELQQASFKRGSTTYFNSSIFFPREVRRDVTVLYAFVRVVDNLVDSVPQQREGFERFCEGYYDAAAGSSTGDEVIDDFVELSRRRGFDGSWVDAFLHSMALDLEKQSYDTIEETLEYIYGSAEVIGLFMARLLDLPKESLHAARMLGRAMQYINFIRDIDEDNRLGRRYLPLGGSGLRSLTREEAEADHERFADFMRREIERYSFWQREAETGFRLIPKRYLIAIKTASDMYNWTARQIERAPLIVFERKVKPRRSRILLQALANAAAPKGGGIR